MSAVDMNSNQQDDRRSGIERRMMVSDARRVIERRSGLDRRLSGFPGIAARPENEVGREGDVALLAPAGELVSPRAIVMAELVAGFYDACIDPSRWPDQLDRIRQAMHADVAAITLHDFSQGTGRLEAAVNIPGELLKSYAETYASKNFFLRRPDGFTNTGAVVRAEQLVGDDIDVFDSEFYRDWLAPQHLFHHVFGVLERDEQVVVCLMLARAQNKGAFWRDDELLLRHLLPSFRQGMQAGRIFNRAHTLERAALGLLNSMPLGVVLVSRHGSVVDANRLAREILAAGDIISSSSGGLTLKLATGRVRVRDLLTNAAQLGSPDGSDVQGYSAPREAGRQPLTVLVARLKPEQGFPLQGSDVPVAALFIGDPERPTEVDLRRLIRLYGLSRAEARVAALLARGQRLDQIAETLGLTYETVRKHVKQIFSKTGTDRQAELVRTIVTGPCGLRL